MLGNIQKKLNIEDGAVQIVEAAFVFPIMFIILFFLIYMGNAYYVKAQVESVVETRALEGAGYCADPILQTLKETDAVPSLSSLKTEPYRYIFGGMNAIENKIASSVESDIESKSASFFKNMEPNLKTSKANIAKFNNYVVYTGNKFTFYHHGKIAVGNKGSGKVSELREFVNARYPQIISGNQFNLGSLVYDRDWELDDPEVINLMENLISYALVRDEYRAYVKNK